MIELSSPNHGPRPEGVTVDIVLVHYTGLPTAEMALTRLCQPGSGVSAHYTIDEDGTIYRHVPEHRRAWHAGVGCWRGCRDINSRSIGIELVNPGHEWGYRPFPAIQMAAFRTLALDILKRHSIAPDSVIGHADIACTRKEDPGELFDWQSLAEIGIGVWPEVKTACPQPISLDDDTVGTLLTAYGYDVETAGLHPCLAAFQRHFDPERLSQGVQTETLDRLQALVSANIKTVPFKTAPIAP
jgi:N-acetylmuramoyl-L-alanine amidase